MSVDKKQTPNSDEIDLVELLAKIVTSIKSNFKLILGAFILGTILGLSYYQFVPKTFESRMLISSDILTESYSKALALDLTNLITENNVILLSSKLRIPEDQAYALSSIEIKSSLEKSENLKEQEKNTLTITCRSRDNQIWPSLQNGIISFFESNDYVKIRVNQRKKYYAEIIEKIDKELLDLNELKTRIANGQMTQSGKENLVLFDPTTVNSKILDLNKEKINLQNSLETVNSIQLVEGFTVFKKPVSPKLSISLAGGAIIGLIFVGMLLTLQSLRKIVSLSEQKLAKS